jgi:spermidine dehydrogenase
MASKKIDRALGMDAPISRRDYLNSVLLGSGAALIAGASPAELSGRADWDGFSGVGDYAGCNGNIWDVVSEGHRIRDLVYDPIPAGVSETGELYDCVVVGGGISGLAAALFVVRDGGPKRTCLVLENHPVFGGEARRNEFSVAAQKLMAHQGSAMWFPPLPGTFLEEFYDSIGIRTDGFEYQGWAGKDPELPVARTPYTTGSKNSAFFFGPKFGTPGGVLLTDPWGKALEGAPLPERTRTELLKTRSGGLPEGLAKHGDAVSKHLDSITLEEHLMNAHGISRETVRSFLSPVAGGGSGLGADALSAYAEYAADVLLPWQYGKGAQMFPGGNAGVARHIVKALIPEAFDGKADMRSICRSKIHFDALDRAGERTRIRSGSTVISVQHEGKLVRVIYAQNGRLHSVKSRSAIIAGGSWTAKHIVKDLPEMHRTAYGQFYRSPCLMANVAVRSWRFLYDRGISECQWFEGIGNYTAVRRVATIGEVAPSISPDSPVVLTLKILFSSPGLPIGEQVTRGRAELFATPFRVYERRIREQLAMVFGSTGFDPKRDIAGLILNRWGHAYLSPQPGFFFGKDGAGGPGDVLRNNRFGAIAFANSDLAGIMDHRTSILEAKRAAGQVSELYSGR